MPRQSPFRIDLGAEARATLEAGGPPIPTPRATSRPACAYPIRITAARVAPSVASISWVRWTTCHRSRVPKPVKRRSLKGVHPTRWIRCSVLTLVLSQDRTPKTDRP